MRFEFAKDRTTVWTRKLYEHYFGGISSISPSASMHCVWNGVPAEVFAFLKAVLKKPILRFVVSSDVFCASIRLRGVSHRQGAFVRAPSPLRGLSKAHGVMDGPSSARLRNRTRGLAGQDEGEETKRNQSGDARGGEARLEVVKQSIGNLNSTDLHFSLTTRSYDSRRRLI